MLIRHHRFPEYSEARDSILESGDGGSAFSTIVTCQRAERRYAPCSRSGASSSSAASATSSIFAGRKSSVSLPDRFSREQHAQVANLVVRNVQLLQVDTGAESALSHVRNLPIGRRYVTFSNLVLASAFPCCSGTG
jgi:hypothetical protein